MDVCRHVRSGERMQIDVAANGCDRRDVESQSRVLAMRALSAGPCDCAARRVPCARRGSVRGPTPRRARYARAPRSGEGDHRHRKVCGDPSGRMQAGRARVLAAQSGGDPSWAGVDRDARPNRAQREVDVGHDSRPNRAHRVRRFDRGPWSDEIRDRGTRADGILHRGSWAGGIRVRGSLGNAVPDRDAWLDRVLRVGVGVRDLESWGRPAGDLSSMDPETKDANCWGACRAVHRDRRDSALAGVANLAVAWSDHHWVREWTHVAQALEVASGRGSLPF